MGAVAQPPMNPWVFRNRFLFLSIVAILYLSYGAVRSERFGGISALIGFGCIPDNVCFAKLNEHILPGNAAVFPTGGYDGQFYYYVAVSLYGQEAIAELSQLDRIEPGPGHVFVDSKGFRLPRIGFPLSAGWLYWLGEGVLAHGMLALLFLSHLLASILLFNVRISAGWLYGLNPVSLLSFGLNLAEPLALSLATISLLVLLRPSSRQGHILGQGRALLAALMLVVSLLSKETLFIVGLVMGWTMMLSAAYRSRAMVTRLRPIFSGEEENTGAVAGLYSILHSWFAVGLLLVSGLAAMGWYVWAGFFSGESAAGKIQIPFSGLVDFLYSGPAWFSGRGLLVFGILWMMIVCIVLAIRAIGHRSGVLERRLVLPGLMLNLLLISFASAEEYWLTFANISRLFAPSMLLLALIRMRSLWMVSLAWSGCITLLLWWNDLRHLL